LLSELVRGEKITVGPPYFDFFLRVLGLPLLLLMGIGPLVAWRRTSLRALGASLIGPAVVALACGVALVALGAGSSPAGLAAYTFCAFVLAAIALEFIRGTRARRSLDRSSWPAAFSSLVGRNRRRYGGYIVHAAIILLALGVAGGAYGSTKVQKLEPGQTMRIGGYDLRYLGSVVRNEPNRTEIRARLAVSRSGRTLGTYLAGKNDYPVEGQVSNEVGIRTDWLRAQDLFLIGDQFNDDGSVVVKALVNPLVDLIWLAGFVFLLGSLIAMWPDEREQRRLARRGAPRARHSVTTYSNDAQASSAKIAS
jgi:cytochrome c-type biogenesis protein CcmF